MPYVYRQVKAQLDKAPRPINFGASPSNVVYSAKIEDKMVMHDFEPSLSPLRPVLLDSAHIHILTHI